jgi:hypothetical protein
LYLYILFLLAKCYAFAHMIVIFLVWEIYSLFFLIIFFFFYLIIWWGIGIASKSKVEVLKNNCFWNHNCFFIVFYFSVWLFYFIIIATSHITGSAYQTYLWVGKDYKPSTCIGIPTHSRVCLEVNTHTGILDYFINNKHIKGRVVNVPKDVYFGVWYFISYLFLFIDMKIL